jgi:hypothetical protein
MADVEFWLPPVGGGFGSPENEWEKFAMPPCPKCGRKFHAYGNVPKSGGGYICYCIPNQWAELRKVAEAHQQQSAAGMSPIVKQPTITFDIVIGKPAAKEGLTCHHCREYFPYAASNRADGGLACWGCRSVGRK